MNLKDLSTNVAFIEGDGKLGPELRRVNSYLYKNGIEALELTHIYDNIRRLDFIKERDVDTVIIQTNGNAPMFKYLIEYFMSLDYEVKNLVLYFEDSSMFSEIINKYPNMHFYFINSIDEDEVVINEQ